jgi:hypothetical protein
MGIAVIPAAGGGVTQKVDVFNSTTSWTAPSNCSSVEVFLVSGGGGGGGAGVTNGTTNGASYAGGGGGGVTLRRILPVTPGQTYTVTIGAGGTAGTSSTNAGVGGSTSFGALLTANGGGAGTGCQANSEVYFGANVNGGTGGGGAFTRAAATSGMGGVGGSLLPSIITEMNPWNTPGATGGTGSQGTKGLSGVSSPWSAGFNFVAGTGLDNYGNPGMPVIAGPFTAVNTNLQSWGTTVQYANNAIGGSSNVQINGNSGAANTGNGGNGGAVGAGNPGVTTNATGGTGGSGYATVTYWS